MPGVSPTADVLAAIAGFELRHNDPLSRHTRFAIGGPARLFAETRDRGAFVEALDALRASGEPFVVIGGGSNLVVADEGFPGVVLRFTGRRIQADGPRVTVEAGAELQALVDHTIAHGLAGLETMTGIPGWVGAAIYGNAGAYGHSISERVALVRFHDGRRVREIDNRGCEFSYRESVFKRRKEWIILEAALDMSPGDAAALARTAAEIRRTRDAKYPPEMKCAGSIFKNLLFDALPAGVRAQVPAAVIREGKVPAAWFLEQVGAKGMRRGDIQVAAYHANLLFNDGQGTARELVALVEEMKRRVEDHFGLRLEEEVQYIGLGGPATR